jgi:hypothetical protein
LILLLFKNICHAGVTLLRNSAIISIDLGDKSDTLDTPEKNMIKVTNPAKLMIKLLENEVNIYIVLCRK